MKIVRPVLSVLLAILFGIVSLWAYGLFVFAFDANEIDTVPFVFALLAGLFAAGMLLLGNRLRKVFSPRLLNILCTVISAFFMLLTVYLLIMLTIEIVRWGPPYNGYPELILWLVLLSAALLAVSIICLRRSFRKSTHSDA